MKDVLCGKQGLAGVAVLGRFSMALGCDAGAGEAGLEAGDGFVLDFTVGVAVVVGLD